MASSPPLSTSEDEDVETGAFGKDKFIRAYRPGGITSPKGTKVDKEGFFDRVSGKALNNQKKMNAELHAKIGKLEEEKTDLETKLQNEIQKSRDQQQMIHGIMKDCSNIQLGDGNTMKILQYNTDNEDPIPLLKQLMRITMEANDEIVHKLTISEHKLTNNSKTLQKIHSVVLQLSDIGSPSTQHQMMEHLKEMVEIPTENDDFVSLEKAFDGLKVDEGTTRFEDLNGDARRGIRIIVYKFGSIKRQAFANALGLKFEKQHSIGEESIDESSCASIILRWLKVPGNNVHKLLGILKGIEIQLIQDYMHDIKEQTFAKGRDTQERESRFQPVTNTPTALQTARKMYESALSLKSTRSDVSDTLDIIERHATETLQNMADSTDDVKTDVKSCLCAIIRSQMDNTRLLYAIGEKLSVTDEKVNIRMSDEKISGGGLKEDERREKYV